jgi:hypothetical protein
MTTDFPKIIWQTHNYLAKDLPDFLKEISDTWKNLNPGWDYRYVDHIEREAVVGQLSPRLLPIYKAVLPMIQADIWRYLVTYEHGGVYADMDSVCTKPIDYMLENIYSYTDVDHEIIVIPKKYDNYTNNSGYLVKEKSYVMKEVIDSIDYAKDVINGMALCSCKLRHSGVLVGEERFAQHSTLINFNEIMNKLPEKDISFNFTAAFHDNRFKSFFVPHFLINLYGKMICYQEIKSKTVCNHEPIAHADYHPQ